MSIVQWAKSIKLQHMLYTEHAINEIVIEMDGNVPAIVVDAFKAKNMH